jgi:hypothetical protein
MFNILVTIYYKTHSGSHLTTDLIYFKHREDADNAIINLLETYSHNVSLGCTVAKLYK